MLWYSSFFRHLTKWCYGTAIAQFFVFLFLFLGVSYLSTLMEIDYSVEVISKVEKYVVLASSLYMVVPFSFSNLFLFGLLHKNSHILRAVLIGSLVNSVVILIVVIGSGIFLAVKGTDYIAYSLIAVGFLLELFLIHAMLLIFGIRDKFQKKEDRGSVNSDSFPEDS